MLPIVLEARAGGRDTTTSDWLVTLRTNCQVVNHNTPQWDNEAIFATGPERRVTLSAKEEAEEA